MTVTPSVFSLTATTLRNHLRYRNFLSQLPPPADETDIAESLAEADESSFKASALREAFTRLRPPERDVLTLCIVEGLGAKAAGAALGIADGTVKSRLHRAKSRLGTLYSRIVQEQQPDAQAILGRRTS